MPTPTQKRLVQKRLADIRTANTARFMWFKWTGFSGKTLWDWLQLLIIPIILAGATIVFGLWQAHLADIQHQRDIQIAQGNRNNDTLLAGDQQQEATLKSYLDDMSDLLLNHNLRNSQPGDEVRQVARARTLTALRRLKADRNRIVWRFLHDTHLIGIGSAGLDLSHADLSGDDLSGADLSDTDLSYDELTCAILTHADLTRTTLTYANLSEANLTSAYIREANLSNAFLVNAILVDAYLHAAL